MAAIAGAAGVAVAAGAERPYQRQHQKLQQQQQRREDAQLLVKKITEFKPNKGFVLPSSSSAYRV